jgi:hypothetical protein
MKKIKYALLMLLAVMLILPSCKKGENDPFISLKSRKARLVGEWKLVEGSSSVVSSSGTDTYTFNGTLMTSVESGVTTTVPYSESYTFEKDGTYKYSSNMNNGEDTDDESGAWTFGTKSTELDVKAKETVMLYGQQYTSVSSGITYSYSYVGTILPVNRITLDMLKSNKMTLLIDYTYTGTGSAFTRTGTWTYEKQ